MKKNISFLSFHDLHTTAEVNIQRTISFVTKPKLALNIYVEEGIGGHRTENSHLGSRVEQSSDPTIVEGGNGGEGIDPQGKKSSLCRSIAKETREVKALVWFWIID
jgi:hypothetical protein